MRFRSSLRIFSRRAALSNGGEKPLLNYSANRRQSSKSVKRIFTFPKLSGLIGAPSWPSADGPADAFLIGVAIALVAFGVVMVYSASAVFAYQKYGNGQYFLLRQAIYAVAGLVLLVVLTGCDYHRIRVFTYPLLFIAIVLVIATFTRWGHSAGGAARWLRLGPISVQPSEIAKLMMIVWLAYSLSKKSDTIRSFSIGFLPHILMAILLMGLCLCQPDFGSAVMFGAITFVMLFAAGAKLAYIILALLAAIPPAVLLIVSSPVRLGRFLAFWEPFKHRYGVGYQVVESLISFGAGGLTGVGLGDSRQKLFFLPEAHTDFISAIVGEELGFIGVAALGAAFIAIVWRGLRAAFKAPDDYGVYLAVGITMFIGIQAFTNLAVAEGLLPTKGLVLPFISYGGSSLLVNCAALGVLLNISRSRTREHRTDAPNQFGSDVKRGDRLYVNKRSKWAGGTV
jgi:cell division protein FtsW